MDSHNHSFVIFPYLKTSRSFYIGGLTFRSTEDREGLSESDASSLAEISEMLFLQNSMRVRSGTYALIPRTAEGRETQANEAAMVRRIQAVIAYCYAGPHPTMGHVFLPSESSGVLLMTADRVLDDSVWPEHHTIQTDVSIEISSDPDVRAHMMPGYRGLLNFTMPFSAVRGCRIYPTIPDLVLNISQDLAVDLVSFHGSVRLGGLVEMLHASPSDFRDRVFTAVEWFNRTLSKGAEEPVALMHLAVAFEALLQLPRSEKTDRFVDAISLILGRVPRLDVWAEQFYGVRSQIAHEGKVRNARFEVSVSNGPKGEKFLYSPILALGREIFQACVSALMFGERMARTIDVHSKLFTNAERFQSVCKIFSDASRSPAERFSEAVPTILALDSYRYVSETGLKGESVIGAVRLASKCLLDSGDELTSLNREDLFQAASSKEDYEVMEALDRLHRVPVRGTALNAEITCSMLLDVAWYYTFYRYFEMKKSRLQASLATQLEQSS